MQSVWLLFLLSLLFVLFLLSGDEVSPSFCDCHTCKHSHRFLSKVPASDLHPGINWSWSFSLPGMHGHLECLSWQQSSHLSSEKREVLSWEGCSGEQEAFPGPMRSYSGCKLFSQWERTVDFDAYPKALGNKNK